MTSWLVHYKPTCYHILISLRYKLLPFIVMEIYQIWQVIQSRFSLTSVDFMIFITHVFLNLNLIIQYRQCPSVSDKRPHMLILCILLEVCPWCWAESMYEHLILIQLNLPMLKI